MELPLKYRNATPGPWHRNIKPAKRYVTVWAGRNTHIANLSSEHMTEEEAEANIQLIADAPMLACRLAELEDALKGMLQCFADDCENLETVIKARQVLAANDNAPCGDDQNAGTGEALVHG